MIAEKIERQAMELKALIQRSMGQEDLVRATRACNAILAEAERVRGLEQAAEIPPAEEPMCGGPVVLPIVRGGAA